MFITAIGTSLPPARYTKADCLLAFEQSDWFDRLDARSHYIARTVLKRDNGIESRNLCVSSLTEIFNIDPNILNKRFLENAPVLAAQAAKSALINSGLSSQQIDAIVISTCTGYLCPGLTSYVIELLGLRDDVQTFDLVGQGCAAALPNLQLCNALLASLSCEHVLSICVEVSSAAMYLNNEPGVLISACLFGDGAGAAVLSRKKRLDGRNIKWVDSTSFIEPNERKALMFEYRDGMLCNRLSQSVPTLAATYAKNVLDKILTQTNLQTNDISAWIMHAGGRDVLLAIEKSFNIDGSNLRYSAAMLREYGNLSSAFVYFVLKAALADNAPDGWWWLSSFGAGFSCHGALLEVSK